MRRRGPEARRRRPRRPVWVEAGVLVVLALVVAILVKAFLVQAFFIPSSSMENTLHVGDRVLVDRVSYHLRDPHRGDVVVFNGVDSFTPETAVSRPGAVRRLVGGVLGLVGLGPPDERDFIKRVIGVAGDRVRCCDADGQMTVNGVALAETSYLFPGDVASAMRFDVKVPDGKLWVMGDHRSVSQDSRAHLGDPGGGMVPVDRVLGRAFAVVWPVGHWAGLGVPATFGVLGVLVAPIARRARPRRTVPS